MFPENVPLHYVYPDLKLTAQDQDYYKGSNSLDTTCTEITCQVVEDLQEIIQCSATPTTQEAGQVYDINISLNKRIDNIDFPGNSYTFKLRTEVGGQYPSRE